ncbi:MAG: anti-sigma factor antagonist [Clostridia bacterium]
MLKEFIECGNTLVAVLSGEIDQYSAAYLRSKIDIEFELSNKKNLVLELSEVGFMDSAGIGLIIGRYKNLTSLGGKTALAAAGPKLKKILELSGVTKLVKIYPDYRSAVEELMR